MELLVLGFVVLSVAPTLIDLLFQYFIHRRTVNRFMGCSKCPYTNLKEKDKEEKK